MFIMLVNYFIPLGILAGTYARVGCELWGSRAIGEYTSRQEENVRSKRKVSRQMFFFFFFFLILCFTSYFMFSIAVLPHIPGVVYYHASIVEMSDQNSRGCPLLFSNRNLGCFCVWGPEILYTHSLWEVVDHSKSKMHET